MDPPAPFHPLATRRVRNHVRVGVGVVVVDSHQRLYAGIRRNAHGAGRLALPGGHLEVGESWEQCAQREVEEEMGVALESVQFCHVTNDIMRDDEKHYVTIFMMGRLTADSMVENCEPHKCEGWETYEWSDLQDKKESLFGPLAKLVDEQPVVLMQFLGLVK